MKATFTAFFIFLLTFHLAAQQRCIQSMYQQQQAKENAFFTKHADAVNNIARQYASTGTNNGNTIESNIITIPVVIHNVYHFPEERINEEQVAAQLNLLNKCFRRLHADAANTPERFRSLAADCEIEFQLAISDPAKRSTNGIIRTYSPIKTWTADDKVKFSSELGANAWDPKQYLNIWVCNLGDFAGYSSFPGGPANKDGIVIGLSAFAGDNKTLVHETGHWLSLKHLWGDANCGDDEVADTPKQASYTLGCPTGIRTTCNNGVNGDMYMNYMDFTSDECTNLFTIGQKNKMRALFAPGGARNALLNSRGLSTPEIFETPLPDNSPQWLRPNLYPNPARNEMILDLAYDVRWMGKTILIINLQGQVVMNLVVTSKNQRIDVSKLQPGVFFIAAKKEDGESMKLKFIKL